MIPSSLARVRPSTQSIDARPVEPEETADDVEEVVDVGETVGESLFVDVGAILEDSVVVKAELLHGFISSSSCRMWLIPRTQHCLLVQRRWFDFCAITAFRQHYHQQLQ
jgi:hypothetical protein